MLQELEILVDHDIQNYAIRLLLNYKPSIEDSTYCFYLPLENQLQHRSPISKDKVQELIDYLNKYLVASQMKEPETDYNCMRGVSVPVDTNPSRD